MPWQRSWGVGGIWNHLVCLSVRIHNLSRVLIRMIQFFCNYAKMLGIIRICAPAIISLIGQILQIYCHFQTQSSHFKLGHTYKLSRSLLNMYDTIFLKLCIDEKHHKNPSTTIKLFHQQLGAGSICLLQRSSSLLLYTQ